MRAQTGSGILLTAQLAGLFDGWQRDPLTPPLAAMLLDQPVVPTREVPLLEPAHVPVRDPAFIVNQRRTRSSMQSTGVDTDGLKTVRFKQNSSTQASQVKMSGAPVPTTGPPPARVRVLVRLGERCYVSSAALTCAPSTSGGALSCG